MDPRAQRTLASLRKALTEMVETMPPADVTVAALCRVAGVHRTTFYNHFDSVPHLAAAAIVDLLDPAERRGTTPRGEPAYTAWLIALLGRAAENRPALAVFLGPDGDPAVMRAVSDRMVGRAKHALEQTDPLTQMAMDPRATALAVGFGSYGLVEAIVGDASLEITDTVEAMMAGLPERLRPALATAS